MTEVDWQAVRLLNYVHLVQFYRIIQISAPPHSDNSTVLPTNNNVDSTVHFSSTYFRKSLPNLCRRCPGYPSCFSYVEARETTNAPQNIAPIHSNPSSHFIATEPVNITQSQKHHSVTSSLGPAETSSQETLSCSYSAFSPFISNLVFS